MAVGQAGAKQGRPRTASPRQGRAPVDLAQTIHALAQLPDLIRLELRCHTAEMDRLTVMAAGYGLENRIELHIAARPAATWLRGAERIEDDPAATLAQTVEGLWPGDVERWASRGDDRLLEGHRVAVVSNLPVPYRTPLFAGIARRLEAVGAVLRVFFLRSSAGSRTWLQSDLGAAFEHEFVSGVDLPTRDRPPRLPLGLATALRGFGPTIAVSAGLSPVVSGRVQRYARNAGIPFGLWSGELPAIAARHSRARRHQRARLVRRSDFAIAYSSLAAQYVAALGPAVPVAHGRNSSVASVRSSSRPARPEPIELMAVGDLASARKGVDVLIRALRAVPELRCRLAVVGGGRLKAKLETDAAADPRIRFLGALAEDAVHAAYADSDVFLFPTREDVFGLVLAEAMSHGLPSVVSPAAGALPDLVLPGGNCLVVEGHEPTAWADAIVRLAREPELRARLGDAARKTIARRWTIEHSVEGWLAGFRMGALISSGARAGR